MAIVEILAVLAFFWLYLLCWLYWHYLFLIWCQPPISDFLWQEGEGVYANSSFFWQRRDGWLGIIWPFCWEYFTYYILGARILFLSSCDSKTDPFFDITIYWGDCSGWKALTKKPFCCSSDIRGNWVIFFKSSCLAAKNTGDLFTAAMKLLPLLYKQYWK